MEIEKKEGAAASSSDVERMAAAAARRRTRSDAGGGGAEEEEEEDTRSIMSVERVFEEKEVPGWKEQLTVRAFAVSAALGLFLSFIVTKLNLTTGIIPSLNVSAGLLGFFLVKLWVKLLENTKWVSEKPFTRQENTVIQTCVVACYGIAFSGGFGSYILAMSNTVGQQQAAIPESETPINIKEPSLGWLIAFMFTVSFVGLFSIIPLRKVMIIDYKLTYPSGTATAHLINSFHTPHGATLAKKQVSMLFKSFCGSFFWSFFQWFYAAGDGCGFSAFPTFGIQAFRKKFYFDFSASYVGVGMICPYIVNISLLLGAIISWGVMWPFIEKKKGIWYDATLSDGSLKGLSGYKVFIPISMILGDGLSNLCLVASRTALDMYRKSRKDAAAMMPVAGGDRPAPAASLDTVAASFDERRRTAAFLKDEIPASVAACGYAGLAALSSAVVPLIFRQLRFHHVAILYAAAPAMAFCNAYGCGLTDWSLASSYGKLAIFAFGSWVGMGEGGIVAGLAACGVMMSVVSTASDLMQDFKTGYLTLASQRSMLVAQAVGTAMGCVIAPAIFWIFKSANDVGDPRSLYPAPYAGVYRGIALIGVEGLGALPEYCINFCAAFFAGAFLLNAFKEIARHKRWGVQHFLPSAMGMAVPFFIGAYFTVDMCVGSVILFLWERSNRKQAREFAPAVASGLLCGDGLWSLPASVLALLKVDPPICMRFFSRDDMAKLASVLT